jgi:hypothetical protein
MGFIFTTYLPLYIPQLNKIPSKLCKTQWEEMTQKRKINKSTTHYNPKKKNNKENGL